MDHIIFVCGKWKFERKKWLFEVDNDQDSKLLAAEETRYEDFLKFIYEDFLKIIYENYGVDFSEHELELTVSVSLACFLFFFPMKITALRRLLQLTIIYRMPSLDFGTYINDSFLKTFNYPEVRVSKDEVPDEFGYEH